MEQAALLGGVLVGLGSVFFSPDRDGAPLGKVPMIGSLCSLCECVFGGEGCGAGPVLLGTRVVRWQSLLVSPACWLQGWFKEPWSNLLCFLTPVKLHPEVCLCTCVSDLHLTRKTKLPAS